MKSTDENSEKLRPLTGKERAYIEYRIANPRATKAQAVRATYDVSPTTKDKTLRNIATTIEKRPPVLAILTAQAEKSEKMLAELAQVTSDYAKTGTKEGAQYAQVAERTLNSILDRVHGKARQQIDVQQTSLSISIDLSSDNTEVE